MMIIILKENGLLMFYLENCYVLITSCILSVQIIMKYVMKGKNSKLAIVFLDISPTHWSIFPIKIFQIMFLPQLFV